MSAVPSTALLYVSNSDGIVNVYRYSKHTLVGELTDFTQPKGECTDRSGNVYITDYGSSRIVEYAHGAKTPLRAINDSPYRPYGCAVNPRNGDLAVANYSQLASYSQGNLAVFVHARGNPKYYSNEYLYNVNACAYDKYGDLLAAGFFDNSDYITGYFGYLAAGSSNFETIDLPFPNSTRTIIWDEVPGVAWDGEYFTVESYRAIYQYSINIKPEFVGTVNIEGGDGPVAFYPPNAKQQATQAVGTGNSENDVFYWDYPSGAAIATITHGLARPFGVAISIPK
jgi:hypothetical protein